MENRQVDTILGFVLNIMFPIKMLLRVYSLCILMIDLAWVVLNAMFAVMQAVYELFRPPPMKSLNMETALVIGAGRGVGRELAIQLADLGAIVLCVDKKVANNNDTLEEIKRNGGSALGFICDITKKQNVEELAVQVKKEIGFVSMVFYCCGIPSPRSLVTQPPQDIHETLDLTLTSYFWLLDQFIPAMKAKNHGHIVALTSVAGLSYIKDQMPLSVAQFAVQGLAESLMEDLRINKINGVHVTLTHIYPFIVGEDSGDLRLRNIALGLSTVSTVPRAAVLLFLGGLPFGHLKKPNEPNLTTDFGSLDISFRNSVLRKYNLECKIPSYFGTLTPGDAAKSILESVRRNYPEASVPKHLLFLGHLLRILPRKATVLIRDLLDTGVDFA